MRDLKQCPICHADPKVGYFCGDYFTKCTDGCPSPMCEHAVEETTVCSWNDWAEWYERNRSVCSFEPLTSAQLRQMDGEPVWNEKVGYRLAGLYYGHIRLYSVREASVDAEDLMKQGEKIYAVRPEEGGGPHEV